MQSNCNLKEINSSIKNGFDKIDNLTDSVKNYTKTREDYSIQENNHWILTRDTEKKVDKINGTLYSTEKGREGLLEQVNSINKKVDKILIVIYAGGGIVAFINFLPTLKQFLVN